MSIDDDSVKAGLETLFSSEAKDVKSAQLAKASIKRAAPVVRQALEAGRTSPTPAKSTGAPVTYYLAHATHARLVPGSSTSGEPFHQFTGKLPLVRFTLPATGDFGATPPADIETDIGHVVAADRKIASLAMVHELTGRSPGRVDLITPPRVSPGVRFGAIALYLCYDDEADERPSFYILEAGTALGAPMVLFLSGPNMAPVVDKQTGYRPTTFSEPTDFYSGNLTMRSDAPGEPDVLTILSTNTDTAGGNPGAGQKPYIRVSVRYEKLAAAQGNDPVLLIVEAAARASIIGTAIGVDAGIVEDLAGALAGWSVDWDKEPG